jgi:hypothetical protein
VGLAISVGPSSDQPEEFAALSAAIAAEDVLWHAPEGVGAPPEHAYSGGFPYSWLSLLRRAYVYVLEDRKLTPAPADGSADHEDDYDLVMTETMMLSSHLLCHADDAGYYVPVDFADPLYLPEEQGIAGAGMVGSSQRLLAELDGLADVLGAIDPDDERFAAELWAWRELRAACRASIAGGHAIVFH